jgi:hypothetical protein
VSAGWSDAMGGGGDGLGVFWSVGFQRRCVGRSSVGLGVRARLGQGEWCGLGFGGLGW